MASAAAEQNFKLSELLLGETADVRERFERNPLFARVFADMVEARAYRQLLAAFHGYYRVLEALLQRRSWLDAGLAELDLNKTTWLERDLEQLGTRPGPSAPLAHLPRIRHLHEAAGACFATEYIAWHAEVAEKHLKLALPRGIHTAVLFVTAYGKSREMQWQRFCQWLDDQPWTPAQQAQVLRAARKTLVGMDAWLRDAIQ